MENEHMAQLTEKMTATLERFKGELTKIRTGRASLSMLDKVRVDNYGALSALSQVATITIPEPRMLVIQPWDPRSLTGIEKAILASDLGLTPASDGKVIRLAIPMLTEERRKALVRQVSKVTEEFRVAVRNLRREANDTYKKMKKEKEISEDEMFGLQEEAQKCTDLFIKQLDEVGQGKEKEIMEI